KGGGLALLQQKSVEVQLQSFFCFHIDVSVRVEDVTDWWRFSGVYGEPNDPFTIRERLDRACANSAWSQVFPNAKVSHGASPYSDHLLVIIKLCPVLRWDLSGGRKCFHSEAAWLQDRACEDIVTCTWTSSGTFFSENLLRDKVVEVSARLAGWGRLFGRQARDKITKLERALMTDHQSVLTEEGKARRARDKEDITKLILQEEVFWK
ncbi:UNVERIFIED_CONTAM: hypothetical protein Sangu_1037700, partial [Sesamum angustifolium]